jgi:putative ABC transport system permease protein
MLTAFIFGLAAPALQTARQDIVEPLKAAGKGISGGFRKGRLRNTLVMIEVALSLVLLAGAGLLMRSFVALQDVELGLNPHHILVARLPLPKGQYETAQKKQNFFQPLLARLAALPGWWRRRRPARFRRMEGFPVNSILPESRIRITGRGCINW